jgi:hypothetical protein
MSLGGVWLSVINQIRQQYRKIMSKSIQNLASPSLVSLRGEFYNRFTVINPFIKNKVVDKYYQQGIHNRIGGLCNLIKWYEHLWW